MAGRKKKTQETFTVAEEKELLPEEENFVPLANQTDEDDDSTGDLEEEVKKAANSEVEVEVSDLDAALERKMNVGKEVTSFAPKFDKEELAKTKREEKEEMLDKFAYAQKKQASEELLDKSIALMTPEEKATRFSDAGVIPIDSKIKYTSRTAKKKQDRVNITKAKITGEVLTGKVTGARMLKGNLYAKVQYNTFTVLIAFEDMNISSKEDDNYIKTHADSAAERRKRLLINERACSEVDFVVIGVDPEKSIAIGNRKIAMQRKLTNFYLSKNRKDEFNAKVGDRVEARIVMVSATRLICEVYGKEFVLFPDAISYARIPNVSAEYRVGDRCGVVFTNLERIPVEGGKWKLKLDVSMKEAEDDPRLDYFDSLAIGDTTTAVVTGIETWGVYCRLVDEDGLMDMMCEFKKDNRKNGARVMMETPPEIGSEVLCMIEGLDPEQLRIRGSIVHVLNVPMDDAM